MIIAVGSKNPTKVSAVERAAKKVWPDESIEVISVEVPHGTNSQPKNEDETIEGATTRAKLALKETNADYGVGLEGGVVDMEHGMFISGWAVIVNKEEKVGIAGTGRTKIPEVIAEKVRNGEELGPVASKHFKINNLKQKGGVIGVLTNNLITRTLVEETEVINAFSRFVNPEYYE
ncbi:MAG: inosine/xanthosine triphosphatase [archaeon]